MWASKCSRKWDGTKAADWARKPRALQIRSTSEKLVQLDWLIKGFTRGNQSSDKKGLGIQKPHDLSEEDDEFDAYRKRMMLAYRFRPNPMNNPRRTYY